jgi:hypothetical protein
MSFLNVNHAEAGSTQEKKPFEPIAEGVYEAVISEVKVEKSSAGNDMIKMTVTIRDDVNQNFAKRKLWDYVVDSEKAKWKSQQIAKALAIPEGTSIATIQEFAKAILYSYVKITIKHKQEEYNGESKLRDFISLYSPSDTKAKGTSTDPFKTNSDSKDIVIPF